MILLTGENLEPTHTHHSDHHQKVDIPARISFVSQRKRLLLSKSLARKKELILRANFGELIAIHLKPLVACCLSANLISGSLSALVRPDASIMKLVAAILLFLCAICGAEEDATKASKKPGPPFFLIDTSDQLCLAGEEFKRCAIDTLFYVVGTPGKSRQTIRISQQQQNLPFL
jgi:hypothetical protein